MKQIIIGIGISLLFVPVIVLGSDISKYAGTYQMPEDETFSDGELVCKAVNAELICVGEQRVSPMGGTMKTNYKFYKLQKNGKAQYKGTYQNYDRWGELLQKDSFKGSAVLSVEGIKLGKEFFKRSY